MTISVYAHIRPNTEVAVAVRGDETGKYAVISAGELSVFVNNREKALEIASMLEKAAQEWEASHELNDSRERPCEKL